jgi:translocation and assembly module TamB
MKNNKLAWVRYISSCLLMGIFFLTGYLFLNTEKGLEIAVQLGKQFIPGKLTINALHGRLLGPIQIKELHYTNNVVNLSVSEAQLDLQWRALLQGKFILGPLFIDKLDLFVNQTLSQKKLTSSQEKPIGLPKFFKFLKFNDVDVHQVNIQTDDIDVMLQGSLHQQWQFNWQLNIKKLGKFIPNFQGKLALQGKINGPRQFPEFEVISQKTNLQWHDWQLKQIQAGLHLYTKSKKWLLDLTAAQLNNKTFKFIPLNLKLSGHLFPFSLQGNLSAFKLDRVAEASQSTQLLIPSTQINSYLSKHGVEASLQNIQGNENQLFVHLLLPKYQARSWITSQQSLNANIDLNLKDLNFLTHLNPELKNPKGIFSVQLKIAGTLKVPIFNLTLHLQQGSANIPHLGLNLKNIIVLLHTDKNKLLGLGQIQSGNGSLDFHTTTELLNYNFSTLINLQGKDITVIHTPEYQITSSPKLKIQANTQQIATEGYIFFPKAKIKINTKNSDLVELSNDIVFVGNKKKSASLPFKFKNDIKIECGDDIQLQYQGLKTNLTGSLAIRQNLDHPVLATGQLKLMQGEYSYYGQSLKLTHNSSLNFANTPINNPILNITASRNLLILPQSTSNTPTDIKSKLGSANFIQSALQSQSMPVQLDIGLNLRGSLQNPNIILFANPSNIVKSQLDMLSYLITGQASNQLSAASIQLLLKAATNLGGGGESSIGQIISKTQQKIGLDQLTIGAKPIFDPTKNSLQQNTSLIVGKNFSPKLNISYSVGLLDPINILEINYFLSHNFSLQSTNTNFANGLDLLYKLEKH